MKTYYNVFGFDQEYLRWSHEISLDTKSDADEEVYGMKNRGIKRTKIIKGNFDVIEKVDELNKKEMEGLTTADFKLVDRKTKRELKEGSKVRTIEGARVEIRSMICAGVVPGSPGRVFVVGVGKDKWYDPLEMGITPDKINAWFVRR